MASPYRVRRALTLEEMTSIRRQIEAADNGPAIAAAALHAVFTALLAPLGESLSDYAEKRRLDPGRFAIPKTQWDAIIDASLTKADAYGSGADVALDLMDAMPSTYDEPDASVPRFGGTDHRPREHVLRVSCEATDTIGAASHHCDRLAAHFGAGSARYQDAVRTWQYCLFQLFSMGFGAELRIIREDDLSLLVESSTGLTYAITFHAETRRCTRCGAAIDDDGRAHTTGDQQMCADGHTPSYALDAPRPGRWSLHS